jgi:hypothetical protein
MEELEKEVIDRDDDDRDDDEIEEEDDLILFEDYVAYA